jgi:uncharacterized protein YdaU (DUF1376 family)
MRLNGLMWWIDRWRKSTAFTDMTLEQQAGYRNLLDEATLRGGAIPNDDRVLAKACGDVTCWKRIKPVIMKRFKLGPDGWRNETLDDVLRSYSKQLTKRAQNRARMRAHRGAQDVHKPVHNTVHKHTNTTGDPDPDPEVLRNPPTPLVQGGRITRAQLKMAETRRNRVYGGCPHTPRCAKSADCVRELALEQLKVKA